MRRRDYDREGLLRHYKGATMPDVVTPPEMAKSLAAKIEDPGERARPTRTILTQLYQDEKNKKKTVLGSAFNSLGT